MNLSLTLTYRSFSKQDKKVLRNFTTTYAYDFSHKRLGGREMWWFIDSIHVGRWILPYRKTWVYTKKAFNGIVYWRKPFERNCVSYSRAMVVEGKWN